MKKLILLSLAFLATFAVSCYDTSNDGQFTMVYGIASKKTTFADKTRDPILVTFLYKVEPTTSATMPSYPRLYSETFSGDTLIKIDYNYKVSGGDSLVAYRHTTDGRVIVDSLKLNSSGMASQVLNKTGAATPYYIKYDEQMMRSQVGELAVASSEGRYVSVNKGGQTVAKYHYTTSPNFIGLQQYTIPGEPYYWATDRFGAHSAWLLASAEIQEDNKTVIYDFRYTYSTNGFVSSETISRDGTPLIYNEYTYTQWVIAPSKMVSQSPVAK